MSVLTVLGARPQFIKAAPVSRRLREAGVREWLLHTGQHYDPSMSGDFFDELDLPAPRWNLEVGSGPPGWQTAQMLSGIEEAITQAKPRLVLVYGDTNSTLAGALGAVKAGVPLAHVEAGVRSWNRAMPEEHNRVLTDHCASLCLCPNAGAVENLAAEGIREGVYEVGDPMLSALRAVQSRPVALPEGLAKLRGPYAVATVHRPYNTDDPEVLARLIEVLSALPYPVVFPVHPRTRARLGLLSDAACGQLATGNIRLVDPLGHGALITLLAGATMVLTDSGGVQREAYWLAVPCVTLRPETEWPETAADGWNVVAYERAAIYAAATRPRPTVAPVVGEGRADERIVERIVQQLAASALVRRESTE